MMGMHVTDAEAFAQFARQAVTRKQSLVRHRRASADVRDAAENINGNTPELPEPAMGSGEIRSIKALAELDDAESELTPLATELEGMTFEESMAALRAQRRARKTALAKHKRTAASCKVVKGRTERRSSLAPKNGTNGV